MASPRRSTSGLLALSLLASAQACSLNPQPEPPGETDVVGAAAGQGGASSGGKGGSGSNKAGSGGGKTSAGGSGQGGSGPNPVGDGGSAGSSLAGGKAGQAGAGQSGASGSSSLAGAGGEAGEAGGTTDAGGAGGSMGNSGGAGPGGAPPSTGGSGGQAAAAGAGGSGGSGAAAGGQGGASAGGQGGGSASAGQAGASGQAGEAGQGGGSGQAGSGGSVCVPVTAAPDADPWSMRAKGAGFGGIVEEKTGGYTDVFLQSPAEGALPAGYTRIGARLDWGGTIVFFGLGADKGSNVIDANDTGRELQIALYDPTRSNQPCAGTATCQSAPQSCGNSITYLGWDPVQGGDECGHGAPVLSHGQAGDALRLQIRPLQWNPDWAKTDCQSTPCGPDGLPVDVTYTFELRYLSVHVVEVMTQVDSTEALDHPPTGQEFPTLYVAHGQNGPDLPLLLDASGAAPAIDQPANDGFFVGNFTSPRPWVSFQNSAQNYGVGFGHDQGLTAFQGWRGDGKSAPYFHNVRAQIAFGLPAKGTVRGLSYLALGSFDTVKSSLEGVLGSRAPFGHIDAPAAGAPAPFSPGSPLHVAGWALDTEHVTKVRVEIDGAPAAESAVGAPRPDVCAVYPAYAGCPDVGFAIDVPTTGISPCQHLLRVIAEDADGNAQVLGERVIEPG